jgi:hypothetical protein
LTIRYQIAILSCVETKAQREGGSAYARGIRSDQELDFDYAEYAYQTVSVCLPCLPGMQYVYQAMSNYPLGRARVSD